MRKVSADEASQIAGIEIAKDCLYLPQSGHVSPRKLCAYYAAGLRVHLNHKIENLSDIDADVIILACGVGALGFEEASFLPLKSVRGQVTKIKATEKSSRIACNICYGGHIGALRDGAHTIGATFQPWLSHSNIIDEDDQENIGKLSEDIPSLAGEAFEIMGHRAACRTASRDHFPVVGQLLCRKKLYISTGHGSYGIISTLAAAHFLGDMILDRPRSQPSHIIKALNPARFCDTPA